MKISRGSGAARFKHHEQARARVARAQREQGLAHGRGVMREVVVHEHAAGRADQVLATRDTV
jgi:hypothetical protein